MRPFGFLIITSTGALLGAAAVCAGALGSVCIETMDGHRFTGTIEKWSLGQPLHLGGPAATTQPIASNDIGCITNVTTAPAEPSDRWRIATTDGQILFGELDKAARNHLAIRGPLLGAIDLSLDAIRTIERTSAAPRPPSAAPTSDCVLLANGDRLEGVVEQADADGVRLQSTETGDARTLAWGVIRRLDLANPPTVPTGQAAILHLADGSILRATQLAWENDAIDADVFNGRHLRLPATAVRVVEPFSDGRTWLSALDPVAYEHRPKLGPTFVLGRDTTCNGLPLRVGGRTYDRGLGLHSACRGEWKLDRRFARLRGLVAIDDSAGPLADATLRIAIDSREVARFEHLKHGEPPRALGLDLTKGDSLIIEVDYGEHADIQDRVDLLDAALLLNRS